MSWTKDEERLLQQVQKSPSAIENRDSGQGESFWHLRNDRGDGIEEYGFETFREIEAFLTDKTGDEDIARILAAAAIREKAVHYKKDHKIEKYEERSVDAGEIPDYVYVF